MLDALIDFFFNYLCYGFGRLIINTVSRGRFPGQSSYWFGLCMATGGSALGAALALVIYFVSLIA